MMRGFITIFKKPITIHKREARLYEWIVVAVTLLFILVMLFGFGTANAADISPAASGATLDGISAAIGEAASRIVELLLAPDSPVTLLLIIIWKFFAFVLLIYMLYRWVFGQSDILELFVFLILVVAGYSTITVPYGGYDSLYVAIASTVPGDALGFANEIMATITGQEAGESIGFMNQLSLKLYVEVDTFNPIKAVLIWLLAFGTSLLFSIFVAATVFVDSIAFVGLSITMVMGAFFIPLIFFSVGVQLVMNWLKMTIGWIFVLIITKVILAIALLSWSAYLGIDPSVATSDFWADNRILLKYSNLNDAAIPMMLPILFMFPLIMSFGWAQALSGAMLPSGGMQGVGLLLLARRFMGK